MALVVGLAVWGLLQVGTPVLYLPLIPVGLAVVFLCLNAPLVGLNLVVAAQYLPVQIGAITILQLVGSVMTVLMLIWYATTKKGFVAAWSVLPLIAFVLLALYSLNFARYPAPVYYAIYKLSQNALLCFLLVNLVSTYRKLRQLLFVVVGMGVLNSAVAAFQVYTGATVEARSRGLLENENALGELTAVAIVVPFYAFLYADRIWKRVLALGCCGVLFFGMVSSISRGALLSFASGLFFMLLREKRYRLRLLLAAALLACALPLLPEAFYHRFENIGHEIRGTFAISQRYGLSTRGYYNKAGIRIWKANPVLGVGIGNYGSYFQLPEFNPGMKASKRLPPHNLYIQALAETGTVGFLVLIFWILQSGFNYWVAERAKIDDERLMILRSCEAMTVIMLITSFTSANLISTQMAMVFAISEVCRRRVGIQAEERIASVPPARPERLEGTLAT